MVDCDLSIDLFSTDDENSPQRKKPGLKPDISSLKPILRDSIQLDDTSDSELEIVDVKNSRRTTPPRKPKREVTDFFVPRDPTKPKLNLDGLVSKRPQKFMPGNKPKKSQKELKFDSKTGVLLSSLDLKPDPGQLSIESHVLWKDNRNISPKFVKKPKNERSKTPPLKPRFPDDSIFKTLSPSNRAFAKARSSSPEFSPRKKFASLAEEFKASLRSPTFLARKKSSLKNALEETKKAAKANPKSRSLKFAFPAVETEECRIQCDALGLEGDERKEFVDKVSRKRARSPEMPSTPEHYWEVDMPDYEEQKRRGYVIETDSPIKVKSRRKLRF